MSYVDYTTDEVVRRGQALYEQAIRPIVEADNQGNYLVIDIETGNYEVGDDYGRLSDRLHEKHPDAALYAMRIGFPALGRIGGRFGAWQP
jgi:hypothetical protein